MSVHIEYGQTLYPAEIYPHSTISLGISTENCDTGGG